MINLRNLHLNLKLIISQILKLEMIRLIISMDNILEKLLK